VPSSSFDGLLALGGKLVAELKLVESTDTLARWMAHYVAELIEAAKRAPEDQQSNAKTRCAEAILGLWAHRGALPPAIRPFEDLKPVIELLETLDPDLDHPYYRSSLWQALEADDTNLDANVKRYLELVGFYPVSTDGLIKAENSRSRLATLRRMRGLWNRSM
jgi:hypothetical protein